MIDELFDRLRPKGFAIAYRMLGSASEAEEVVQEAFLRLYRELEEGSDIESPEAYFTTVVTRLSIDELRSARARREVYTGEWLPEPILTAEEEDPARHAEIADSLSLGLLVVLETLTPEERAVFLLREVFDYPHDRIAEVLGKSPAAVRQLAVRARGHVGEREPRFETSREQHDRLAASFFDAYEEGNLQKLESLLAAEASLHGDGGGKAPALARALLGRGRVARAMMGFRRRAERFGGVELRRAELNGGLGALAYDPDGRLISALIIETDSGEIQSVNSIVNPDKLGHLGPVADVNALLKKGFRP
ncbi:MAG TPA: RNA polymerase sigma factor SigJ [Solirubrobacterales bacterium]